MLIALPAAAHGGVERQLGLTQCHLTRLRDVVDRDALLRRLGLDLLAQRAVWVHVRGGDGPDPDPVQKLRHAPGVVLVEMRQDQEIHIAGADGLQIGRRRVPRSFCPAAVDECTGLLGRHDHALPLPHIQDSQRQVLSLHGLCREQGGQAQRHHAGTGRQDRPFLLDRSQEIQQHKPIDEQGPRRVIAPVHLHRRQTDLTGLPRKPEELTNGQTHQPGQKMPDGKTNCAHQHRQRPAHKGQRHRPARAEIRQGGNE